jgi:AAA+ superfamily predicted ATPase
MKFLDKKKKNSDYYNSLTSLTSGSSGTPERLYQSISNQELFNNDKFYEVGGSRIKISDVFQSRKAKISLDDIIEEYRNKDKINKFGLKFDNKILFYGPSGCGKTLSALALANSLKKKIYIINLATVVNSGLGKTSNNLFDIVEDAKSNQAIIFFDEFDALSKIRSDENDHGEIKRIASALLQILDFIDDETIFIAATNYPELIDSAITRRFNNKIEFSMPDKKNMRAYLCKLSKIANIVISKQTINKIAEQLSEMSYAEARDSYLSLIKKYIIKYVKKEADNIKVKDDILNLIKK